MILRTPDLSGDDEVESEVADVLLLLLLVLE
jgi:hypothetical protein